MSKVIEWLKGKKTFFILGAAGIVWYLSTIGIITPEMAGTAYTGLTILGGATMADKINRLRG